MHVVDSVCHKAFQARGVGKSYCFIWAVTVPPMNVQIFHDSLGVIEGSTRNNSCIQDMQSSNAVTNNSRTSSKKLMFWLPNGLQDLMQPDS